MFGLGVTELIIILVIIIMIFGAGKLPEIGSAIGKTIRGFKKATRPDGTDNSASLPKNDKDKDKPS